MTAPAKLESRVAVLEEIARSFTQDTREYRLESKSDIKEILARLDAMQQTLASTGNAVHNLTLQDCGTRITALENRIVLLEERATNIPQMERDVDFFRRVLGVGWGASWRLLALAIGSGGVAALIAKIWH